MMCLHDDDTGNEVRRLFGKRGFVFPCAAFAEQDAAELLCALTAYQERLARFPALRALHGAFKPHLLTCWADRIVHCPTILDVVESLLGPHLLAWSADLFVRHGADMAERQANDPVVAPRPGLAPRGLTWHQDAPYLGLEPLDRVVRVWLALTPTKLANGTMRYLPGSHLLGELPHAYAAEDGSERLRGQRVQLDVDERTAVTVELRPGEFSVHDVRTVHASGENVMPDDRVCLAVTYIAPDVRPRGPRDSAMLVRGIDEHGYYALEARPLADLDPAAITAYLDAVTIRMRRIRQLFGADPSVAAHL